MFQRTYTMEKHVGYCRALKAGDHVYLTGTAPVDGDGRIFLRFC